MLKSVTYKGYTAKGFTLIELIIVISLVGILASIFFSRVLFYQEMAEKSSMQQVVSALQSALVLQYGHRLALSMGPGINDIKTENPMNWLALKPSNYAGEFPFVRLNTIKPGNWAFDQARHELVYVPNHNEYFIPAENGIKWIRFRTRFAYENRPGSTTKSAKELTGVTFAPVEPYQWLLPEN